jgi:hypothetical protein
MEDLNQVLRVRREKLSRAQRRPGIEPFAYAYRRVPQLGSTPRAALRSRGGAASELNGVGRRRAASGVAGRIVSWRGHGKSAFAHLSRTRPGAVQIYLRKDVLGDERFEQLDLLDLGDWIGVEGPTFRTRTGEVTVRAESWTLLTKSLAAAPVRKGRDRPGDRRADHAFGVRGPGGALPAALRRPRGAPRGPRGLPRSRARIITALRAFLDGRGLPRGRDAGAAAPVRRRVGQAVRDAASRARSEDVPAHRRRAVPEATDRGRARPGLRDLQGLPERGALATCTTPSSPCSSGTRRSPTTTIRWSSWSDMVLHVLDEVFGSRAHR